MKTRKHVVNKPCRFCGETNYQKLYIGYTKFEKDGTKVWCHLDLCYECGKKELNLHPRQKLEYYFDMSETEKAYLAGVIDCDGHIGLVQRKKGKPGYYDPRVTISNTNQEFAKYFKERYKGVMHIQIHRAKSYDNDSRRHPENWKPKYQIAFVSARARSILRTIYPYLIGKKDQADCIFEYSKTILPCGCHVSDELKKKRIIIYNKLRALTKRGIH